MDNNFDEVNLMYQLFNQQWLYEKNENSKAIAMKLKVILDKMGRYQRVTDLELLFIEEISKGI